MPVICTLNMLKVLKEKINRMRRQRGKRKQMEFQDMKNLLSKMKHLCDQAKRNLGMKKKTKLMNLIL